MIRKAFPFVLLALAITLIVVSCRHYLRVSELSAKAEALEEAARKLCEAGHLEHAHHVNARNTFRRTRQLFAVRHTAIVSVLDRIKDREPRVHEGLRLLADVKEAFDAGDKELAGTDARYDELMQPFRRYTCEKWGWP